MADDVINALAKLRPAAANRDAILFAAGRTSGRRGPWRLLLVGLMIQQVLLISIWTAPKAPEKIVYVNAEAVRERVSDDSHPTVPESPSIAPHGPGASLLNLDPESSEPIPSASTLPEQHWTVRTAFTDL